MAGSTFGTLFRITTWGESHGKAVGVTVDGCPAGLPLDESDIQAFLDLRRPGQNAYTTKRSEEDEVSILSGIFEGKTTGTPISMLVFNKDQRSRDYGDIASYYRPGHADLTFDQKYGFRDYRGGGRSSGRETIGRVAAGAIASRLLGELGLSLCAYTQAIGPVSCDPDRFDAGRIRSSILRMPDAEAETKAQRYLDSCIRSLDSSGGLIECRVTGMLPGLGEPVFDKLDARLGQALFSIGAVKGVEIGSGMAAAGARGSENNDQYGADGKKLTNHAGGILGGISDGSDLFIRAAVKPTASIASPQTALFQDGKCREVVIKGRHDPVIVPRAVIVVESMVALTLADLAMINATARLDNLKKIYRF